MGEEQKVAGEDGEGTNLAFHSDDYNKETYLLTCVTAIDL